MRATVAMATATTRGGALCRRRATPFALRGGFEFAAHAEITHDHALAAFFLLDTGATPSYLGFATDMKLETL